MKVSVLASGSRGNSVLVRSGDKAILIDLGISARRLKERLDGAGESLRGLEGIFISHEHTDHISGLGNFHWEEPVPIFCSSGTGEELRGIGMNNLVMIKAGERVELNGFSVQGFRVPHDAKEPLGFIIESGGVRLVVATDLGSVNTLVRERLKSAQVLIIESNHDLKMLKEGAYPWELKQRIMSRYGHLSNSVCAGVLSEVCGSGLIEVVLGHLSENNNTPELAYRASREVLPSRIKIHLTSQRACGPVIKLE